MKIRFNGTHAFCRGAWVSLLATRGLLAGSLAFLGYGAFAGRTQVQRQSSSSDVSAVFESKVRPILETKCIACHGSSQQLKGLRLDRPISADMAVRVHEAISYNGDVKMPPSGKLAKDDLAILGSWAKAGAPWPTAVKAKEKSKARFWAFVPPKTPALPKVNARWWAQNPIDRFVLAKLEEKGLRPTPPADRPTLIRRATFDLTGLPPTPQEIDAFLADTKPNAFERVIDRLLASPAYGERWGRHWLDVARYADSNGLDENLVFADAWRYRDYVIGAFNSDKPIDRFFQEQLAGDLLPDAGDGGVVATGFLALGAKMLAEDDPVKQELDVIDEQIDTTTKTCLALTVGCARCHDHKFDPISAKDYYSLAGIFKSTKTMLNYKNMAEWNERPLGPKAIQEKLAAIESQIKTASETANKKRDEAGQLLLKQLQSQQPAYEAAARRQLATESRKSELQVVIADPNRPTPAEAIVRDATDFTAGNVHRDRNGYGKDIGIILNGGVYPNWVEYEISVPVAGPYQLDLRYASGDPRPLRVYANGALVLSNAAGELSGGFYPQHQKWFAEGIFALNAGVNRIKLERDSYFPHINKLLLLPRPGKEPTETQLDSPSGSPLIPQIVQDLADRIKSGGEIKIELPDNADPLFPDPVKSELKKLDEQLRELGKAKREIPTAMAVSEGKPTNLRVHLRGNYLTLGTECVRQFPAILTTPQSPIIPPDHSGRLELAQWLTSPKNPLTARVFVNRVWRWRFGRGIVASVDNFGALGDLPTHPELLDWLATTFVDTDHWSLKKFHKRLMLTNTYMMGGAYNARAATLDPDNHLLWRFPRQRLEAEEIRDSILFVAGTLDRTMGGTTINLPPRSYVTSTASNDALKYDSTRRAIYLPVIRSALYDVYTAFDFGDPTVMNGDRSSTTVAPQALFMLNSPVVLSATKAEAESLLKQDTLRDDQRVQDLYRTNYGRPATKQEVARALTFLNRFQAVFAKSPSPRLRAWQSLCKSVIAANEFIYVE